MGPAQATHLLRAPPTYHPPMHAGDGFVTNDNLIQEFGLTDPKPILNEIQAAPYRNQVVISPHYYPPSISGQTIK